MVSRIRREPCVRYRIPWIDIDIIQKLNPSGNAVEIADEEAFYLLDDYDSGDDTIEPRKKADHGEAGGVSAKSFDLLNKYAFLRLNDGVSMFNS